MSDMVARARCKSADFGALVDEVEADERLSWIQKDFARLLSFPLERIHAYREYLSSLASLLSPENPAASTVSAVYEDLGVLAGKMAEAQRKKDVQGEIHTLQRKFTDDTVISSIGREILCVGELRVVSGRNASFFEFILLSDLLLQAQKSLDESLKLVAKFDMKFLTVAECKDSSTDFYIYNKSTPILLRSSSMKEMVDWVRRIKEASRAA
eukprot:68520_1